MAPAQERRKRIQDDLREASEIASELVKSDLKSVSSKRARAFGCSHPKTELERKAIAEIQSLIIQTGKRARPSNQRKLETALDEAPSITRLFLPDDKKNNREGWLCIHLAASVGNQEAFESIYDHDPECAEFSTEDGKTPAHLAVIGEHLGVARSIVARAAQSCRLQDTEGNLPLHLVLGHNWRKNKFAPLITSILLVGYPSGMSVRNPIGEYPIHLAAKEGFCPGIRGILSADIRNVYRRSKTGYTAVDLAIDKHAELSRQLQSMHQVQGRSKKPNPRRKGSPSGMSEQGKHGKHTSSWHCESDSKNDATEMELIEQKSQYEECIEVLLMSALYCMPVFLPRDERHVDKADAPFFLPLHAGLFNRLKKESWEHLVDMFGKMHAFDIDQDGQTLLHAIADYRVNKDRLPEVLECYNDEEIIDMIKCIHAINPKAHAQPDYFGRLPLHLSILSGASASVVRQLIQCGVKAIQMPWLGP
mmetsp:Transcript_25276/g.35650  ORF Transcript_25276/g.35650 Transcript_25276/m.35650 type:complete len:477 (-) Transcript_25276:247-1677(-)